MAKQKLVMIGNGMAGLRTIEEILERSQSQFDITIIGKNLIRTITELCYPIFYRRNDRRRYNYESL